MRLQNLSVLDLQRLWRYQNVFDDLYSKNAANDLKETSRFNAMNDIKSQILNFGLFN